MLLFFCLVSAAHAASKERVAWGGVSFRGKAIDREKNFPFTTRGDFLSQLNDTLAERVRSLKHPDANLLVGQDFNYGRGDGLMATLVIDSEDLAVAELEGDYFGQLIIAGTVMVFDFQTAIIVASSPVGVFQPIRAGTTKPDAEYLAEHVRQAIGGLGDDALSKLVTMPIRPKANFGRLQIQLAKMDSATCAALRVAGPDDEAKWGAYFAGRLASLLAARYGVNVLPVGEGDGTLAALTINFSDKARLSAAGTNALERILQMKPPTVTAVLNLHGAASYVDKKYSKPGQVAKRFGCMASVRFQPNSGTLFTKDWAYAVIRQFSSDHVDTIDASVLRVYYRAAIDDGLKERFAQGADKDKAWLAIVATIKN